MENETKKSPKKKIIMIVVVVWRHCMLSSDL